MNIKLLFIFNICFVFFFLSFKQDILLTITIKKNKKQCLFSENKKKKEILPELPMNKEGKIRFKKKLCTISYNISC